MDVLFEPFSNEGKFPFCYPFAPVGVFFREGGKELSGADIAEGVSGEVAKIAEGPMDILQAPFGIGFGSDSEKFFHFSVPCCGQIVYSEGAANELFFNFKAEDDVEAIGHFVGFDANEGGLYSVDGAVEFVEGHLFQLGQRFLQ